MKEKLKKEATMGKFTLGVAFLMVLCCALPVILVAIGLGAIGAAIQSNLLIILAGLVLVCGIGYAIYRKRCKACSKKPREK